MGQKIKLNWISKVGKKQHSNAAMTENNLHVAVLKYGEQRLNSGVSFKEMVEHLANKGLIETTDIDKPIAGRVRTIMFHNFTQENGTTYTSPARIKEEAPLFINTDGAFKLFELQELLLARASSISATRWAAIALLVSIATGVWSGYTSFQQLQNPTTLNSEQFDAIQESQKELHEAVRLSTKSSSKESSQQIEAIERAVKKVELSVKSLQEKQYGKDAVATK